jgi:undecaprenyl diphosphate synthase
MDPTIMPDPNTIPSHIGIIMDGNGRWARMRNLPRTQGHIEGLKAAKRIVTAAAKRGIRYMTLYTFSTENWKRTQDEVGFLMGLIKKNLLSELDFYRENNIRIRHCGDISALPDDIALGLRTAIEETSLNDGLCLSLAINYGGRDEIVRALKKMASHLASIPRIDEKTISAYLDNPDIPDPDLIIRTAGEFRTSNFLLWESAYSEYIFSPKLWPEWDASDLEKALSEYAERDRRFGGVKV